MLHSKTIYITAVSALVLVGIHVKGKHGTEPSRRQVFDHRLPRVDWIRTPGGGEFRGLVLRIAVDEHGAVTSAEVTEGPKEFREAALTLAKTWKYKPFQQAGKPQAAIFTDYISLLPPERPARMNVPFPAVHDWTTMRITLKRTRCYGGCPAYELQISGNGDVLFEGSFPGKLEQHGKLSRVELERLLDAFRTAHYYGLDREYIVNVTDLPAYITSISIDGQSMSVTDYGGLQVGMPTSVADLESAIDQIAGTSKWLHAEEGR